MSVIQTSKRTTVMIASIVSNQSKWLKRFLGEIDSLSYPKEQLTYSFLTGNNNDETFDILDEFEAVHQDEICWSANPCKKKVWLKGNDMDCDVAPRYPRLSMLRNLLIDESLGDEDYVLMIDSDIVDIPKDLIQKLLNIRADISAPMVFIEDFNEFEDTFFYDSLAFLKDGIQFDHLYPYIPTYDVLPSTLVDVDSVGTCYLCKAAMFTNGSVKYIGTESLSEQVGFCQLARENGYTVRVDPTVSVLHVNFEKYGGRFKD